MIFKDKFIAFVDILGFKNLVRAAESRTGISLSQLAALTRKLGSSNDRKRFEERGPIVCPESPYLQRDLDFQILQVSDCVIVSCEISPSGVIHLIHHCWTAVMELLDAGYLCRGYIKRGSIYHEDGQVIGSGYQEAYEKERTVAAFKRDADDRGTPFVEIDSAVCNYVKNCGNACVKEMFSRYVKSDGAVTALFPFQRLQHTFAIGGPNREFDAATHRASNENVRTYIKTLAERINANIDKSNPSAVRKGEHYAQALMNQLQNCAWVDSLITALALTSTQRVPPKQKPVDIEAIKKIKDLPDWPPVHWKSEKHESLPQETALTCVVKNVIVPVINSNFVDLEILHNQKIYSAALLMPKELKDRVGFTLIFCSSQRGLTLSELGELDLI
jgi:hypothetical protein